MKKNPFRFEKSEESSGFLLWQVTSLWQRGIRKELEACLLTHSQFVLLASAHWLSLHNQDVTQILLSDHTKIDPMTTSSVLRTLEGKKLLRRREHPQDTRAKKIELTKAGQERVQKAVKLVEDFDDLFFKKLGSKSSELNKLLQTLIKEHVK